MRMMLLKTTARKRILAPGSCVYSLDGLDVPCLKPNQTKNCLAEINADRV